MSAEKEFALSAMLHPTNPSLRKRPFSSTEHVFDDNIKGINSRMCIHDVTVRDRWDRGDDPVLTLPSYRLPASYEKAVVTVVRICLLLTLLGCFVWRDVLQQRLDVLWSWLLTAWWFNTVYFETVWATLCYAVIISLYPFTLHFLPWMDRFKVHQSVTYVHQPFLSIMKSAVWYMTPLALLDTVIVKKYCGVDPTHWHTRELSWIQTTRALPTAPPTVGQLFFQVIVSVVIYDAIFFFIHLTLHKNRRLYSLLHAPHHQHDVMHAHVTNQLSMAERITLVLAANQALKIVYSHPLSRATFVPVFVWLLVDNHSGYDFPWALHHVLPAGLLGGPRAHYAHHVHGTRHYQPFLTYLDTALAWFQDRRTAQAPCDQFK